MLGDTPDASSRQCIVSKCEHAHDKVKEPGGDLELRVEPDASHEWFEKALDHCVTESLRFKTLTYRRLGLLKLTASNKQRTGTCDSNKELVNRGADGVEKGFKTVERVAEWVGNTLEAQGWPTPDESAVVEGREGEPREVEISFALWVGGEHDLEAAIKQEALWVEVSAAAPANGIARLVHFHSQSCALECARACQPCESTACDGDVWCARRLC